MPNRLPELVHYLIWRCDPADLGATNLNKICWYSDLDAYRTLGHTITGAADYIRLQFGPTPKGVHTVIEQLFQKGQIAVLGVPRTVVAVSETERAMLRTFVFLSLFFVSIVLLLLKTVGFA